MTTAKKTAKKQQKPSGAVKFTKSVEEIPSFYTNNTNVTVSAYDFKLIFGQVVETPASGAIVDPQIAVFMSPQHAKAIADLLTNQIKIFEEKTGQPLAEPPPPTK